MHCLFSHSDAANYIVEALLQVGEQQRQLWMDKILATVQKQPLDTAIIGRDMIRDVLQVTSHSNGCSYSYSHSYNSCGCTDDHCSSGALKP